MKPRYAIVPLLAALILAACDSGGKGDENAAASPPPKLFETQRNALDKAKGIENTVQQQAQDQKQDVDQQTK